MFVYVIKGRFEGYGWWDVDEFDTLPEAKKMLREYMLAYHYDTPMKIIKRYVKGRRQKA